MTNFDVRDLYQTPEYQAELASQRTFMARVYGWMTIGLLVTALTALVVASSTTLLHTLFETNAFWVLIILWFALGLGFRFVINSVPVAVASAMFVVYSILTGAALSSVLLVYTATSIATTFFVTAGMFGGVSAYGYLTKRSLDGLGSLCIMGLWGLILASIVNIFMGSGSMDWIISIVGVLVFTGLTAYETQKFKQAYADHAEGSAGYQRTALLGAFELYLDFINLFLYLLRFLGDRRD